jgi:hypothetical protein
MPTTPDRFGEASGGKLPTGTEPGHDHVGITNHDGPFTTPTERLS